VGTNQEFCSSIELSSFELAPYVGYTDKKTTAKLRLKRMQARAWMKSKGIKDLGLTERAEIKPQI
jgi:hypothetical protein